MFIVYFFFGKMTKLLLYSCKNERETAPVPILTEDKNYVVQMKLKASSVSYSEERMVQHIVVVEDDIMSSIQHH